MKALLGGSWKVFVSGFFFRFYSGSGMEILIKVSYLELLVRGSCRDPGGTPTSDGLTMNNNSIIRMCHTGFMGSLWDF